MLNSIVADGEKFVMPKWFWLVLGCGLMAIIGMRFVPLLANRPTAASPYTMSMSNMKQLGTGMTIYCADYDDLLPISTDWGYQTQPYVRSLAIYDDPTLPRGLKYGYGFYAPLSSKNPSLYDDPSEIPLLFQSNFGGLNEHGDLSRMPPMPRGSGGTDIYANADGSAKVRPRVWATKPVVMKRGTPKKKP